MNEEWGTPVSKEKIIARRNRLIEYQKLGDLRFTPLYEAIDENILDINYMIYEIERLNKERKAIKKYVHNHTITYIDNGIECCKPDEYFNISWVEDMLDGNFENLEVLFEDNDKE